MEKVTNSIAIIGFGAAGIACHQALVKKANYYKKSILIDIYQPEQGFGSGVPYQKDADYICLNHHHNFICIDKDDSLGFTNWLQIKHPFYLEKYDGYQPRWLFSEYILEKFFDKCSSFFTTTRIFHEKISSLNFSQEKYQIQSSIGIQNYNQIIIAIGHPDPTNLFNLSGDRYINQPYPVQQNLNKIPRTMNIAILGMGLTGIDCVIQLIEQKHCGKITLISRSGHLCAKRENPQSFQCNFFTDDFLKNNLKFEKFKLKAIANALNKDLKSISDASISDLFLKKRANVSKDRKWQNVLYSCNSQTELAWSLLSEEEKKIFFNYYHNRWLQRRVGIAPNNYDKLMHLKTSKKLEIIGGLEGVDSQFILTTKIKKIKVDWIINATGSPRFLSSCHVPLLNDLIQKQFTEYYQYGGINVDFNTSQLKNKNEYIQKGLYAIGHITTGVFLYTPIMDHIVRQADKIANNIIMTI